VAQVMARAAWHGWLGPSRPGHPRDWPAGRDSGHLVVSSGCGRRECLLAVLEWWGNGRLNPKGDFNRPTNAGALLTTVSLSFKTAKIDVVESSKRLRIDGKLF